MPLSERRKKELAAAQGGIIDYGGRYMCPACSRIHHFQHDHCHNEQCGYKGKLVQLKEGKRNKR